jgi:hypothetical protein
MRDFGLSFIRINKVPHTKVQYLPSIRDPKSHIGGRAVKPARTRRARAMHGENLRKFTETRARAPYPFDAIIFSRTIVCSREYASSILLESIAASPVVAARAFR